MTDNQLIGSGWSFPLRFNLPESGPKMVAGETLLQQSLYVLLNTRVGERAHDASFGCGLHDYLFQVPDTDMLTDIKEEIAKSVEQYEHRITLNDIRFDTADIYNGVLNIYLDYHVNSTNQPGNLVFPFYLSEG